MSKTFEKHCKPLSSWVPRQRLDLSTNPEDKLDRGWVTLNLLGHSFDM